MSGRIIALVGALALAGGIIMLLPGPDGQNTASAAPAPGTIALDTSSLSRSTATFSHTVPAGDDRLLAVAVMIEGATYSGISTIAL